MQKKGENSKTVRALPKMNTEDCNGKEEKDPQKMLYSSSVLKINKNQIKLPTEMVLNETKNKAAKKSLKLVQTNSQMEHQPMRVIQNEESKSDLH